MAFLPVSPWSVGNDLKCLLTDGSLIPFQRLAELLKSKKPGDLQEANRLIKNMVKEVCENQKWLLFSDQYVIAVFERHLTQNDGDPFLKQELLHTGCITNEKHTNAKLFQSAIITPASTWFFWQKYGRINFWKSFEWKLWRFWIHPKTFRVSFQNFAEIYREIELKNGRVSPPRCRV